MNKTLSFKLLAFSLVLIPGALFAQATSTLPVKFPINDEFIKVVEVGITKINLDKTEFSAGDTISGTVVLYSSSDQVIPDLTLVGSIVSGYKDLSFSSVIDKQTIQTGISTKVGVMQEINFTYKLPTSGIVGDNALYLEVLTKNGDKLGYNATPIKIKGLSSFVEVSRAWVQVGKNLFFLQQGPSVRPEDKAFLHLDFKSTENIVATPQVSIYDFEAFNDPLKKNNLDKINISADATTSLDIPISISGLNPGVYVGQVSLINDKNIPVSETLEYRFVVWGDIATIRNIAVDKTFGKKDEVVSVSVEVIGSPTDVMTKEYREFKNASLEMIMTDMEGNVVSENSIKFDLATSTKNSFSGIIPMKLTNDSSGLSLNVILKDSSGKVLDSSVINFSGEPVQKIPEPQKIIPITLLFWLAGGLIKYRK